MKQALNQPWQPEQNGFEFSLQQLTLWMERLRLKEQADDFKFNGYLPDPEDGGPALSL